MHRKSVKKQSIDEINGMQYDENWLSGATPAEYREKIYIQMKRAQKQYLERKAEAGFKQEHLQPLKDERAKYGDNTVSEAFPQFDERRKLYKKKAICSCSTVTRYFTLSNDKLLSFETANSEKVKECSLKGATIQLESQGEVKKDEWHCAELNHRAAICMTYRKMKPVFYYSNDMNQLKALSAHVKLGSNDKLREKLKEFTDTLSTTHLLFNFIKFWGHFRAVYDKRVNKMIRLQTVDASFGDIATQNWQRNRKFILLLKQRIEQSRQVTHNETEIKPDNHHRLASTFRKGRAHQENTSAESAFMGATTGLFAFHVMHRLGQVAHCIKNRRLTRDVEIQHQINHIYDQHIKGYRCPTVQYQKFDDSGKAVEDFHITGGNGKLCFEPHTPDAMIFEDLTTNKMTRKDYFEKDYLHHIKLSEVSMMSTDLIHDKTRPAEMEAQKEYTINLYGHFLDTKKLRQADLSSNNVLSEVSGYSVIRRKPIEQYEVDIDSISLPIDFVRKYNKRAFIRVKLTQSRFKIVPTALQDQAQSADFDTRKMFYVIGRDYRLNFTEAELAQAGDQVNLEMPDMKFYVDRLIDGEKEQYQLSLLFFEITTPIPTVVKDLLPSKEFQAWDFGAGIEYLRDVPNMQKYKVRSDDLVEACINFRVWYFKKLKKPLDEREGTRLLVGRYCLLDDRKQMQVMQFNKDDSMMLRSIHTHEPLSTRIPIDRVKFIERYGVSVYDSNNLPEMLKQSNFSWTCKIVTTNKRLINEIQAQIQRVQVNKTFARRWVGGDVRSNCATGKILCSLFSIKNIWKSPKIGKDCPAEALNPFVRMSVVQREGKKQKVKRTPKNSKVIRADLQKEKDALHLDKVQGIAALASFCDKKDPFGQIIDLGEFSKIIKDKYETQAEELGGGDDSGTHRMSSLGMQRQDSNLSFTEKATAMARVSSLVQRRTTKVSEMEKKSFEQTFIKFEVFNAPEKAGAQNELLGTCEMSAVELIDVNKLGLHHNVMLKLPVEGEEKSSEQRINTMGNIQLVTDVDNQSQVAQIAGCLEFQTMFVPNLATRFDFDMYLDTSSFRSPESYLHYQTLLNGNQFDYLGYQIPLDQYNPEDHTPEKYFHKLWELKKPNLLQQQGAGELESKIKKIMGNYQKVLETHKSMPEKGRIIAEQQLQQEIIPLKAFASREEIYSFSLWLKNRRRPMRQDFGAQFLQLWAIMQNAANRQERSAVQEMVWRVFMAELATHDDVKPLFQKEDLALLEQEQQLQTQQSFVGGTVDKLYRRTKELQAENNPENDFADFGNLGKSMILHNKKVENLIFSGQWEKQGDQKYSDLRSLVYAGIPDDLRAFVYRDLLKVQIVEYEEVQNYKRTFGKEYPFDKRLTIFQNYKQVSERTDCLAFTQVDEDVGAFKFPDGFLADENIDVAERNRTIVQQKVWIRNLLRAILLWSKQRSYNGQEMCFAYNDGMIKFIQKMLTLTHSEEDVFWIIIGLIRLFPRPFSVHNSVLEGDTKCVMRYEMIAFKALIEQFQPEVFKKLKDFGLPIELLVYEHISSFYANIFRSEIVLRLWDIMIFNFCTVAKDERKRGIWYLLAPSYCIFKEKTSLILQANSINEIVSAVSSNSSSSLSADQYIAQVESVINHLFVEDLQADMTRGMTKFFRDALGMQPQIGNQSAFDFEELRAKYQNEVKHVFEAVRVENMVISGLMGKNQIVAKNKDKKCLNYEVLRKEMMAEVGNIALSGEERELLVHNNQLHKFDDELKKADLDLSRVYVYIHSVSRQMRQFPYKLRVSYGKVEEVHQIFTEKECGQPIDPATKKSSKWEQKLFSAPVEEIGVYYQFKYDVGYNHIKIDLIDDNNNVVQTTSEALIPLEEMSFNGFTHKRYTAKNTVLLDDATNYVFSPPQIRCSFFLRKKKTFNTKEGVWLNSLLQKAPERIDIFNKHQYKKMSEAFAENVEFDFLKLVDILSAEDALSIINDHYGYVEQGDYGSLDRDDFIKLCSLILPRDFRSRNHLTSIYDALTGSEITEAQFGDEKKDLPDFKEVQKSRHSMIKSVKSSLVIQKDAVANIKRGTITANSLMTNKDMFGQTADNLQFSLRQFLSTYILMSHCTVRQKLDIFYDLFDWSDGSSEGIKPNVIYDMMHTIFERNLYFWPQHELQNLIEMIFTGHVSMCYKAYWTSDVRAITENRANRCIDVEDLKRRQEPVDANGEGTSVDVTHSVQAAFTKYFAVFGNRTIDFNPDVSPFKKLDRLVGHANKEACMKLAQSSDKKYKMVLFCTVAGERFSYEVNYDNQTEELEGKAQDPKDIGTYFGRFSNKLFLSGLTKPISKKTFMCRVESVPLFTNLLRVETFWRDRVISTLKDKKKLNIPVVVTVSVEHWLIVFKFEKRTMKFKEGTRVDKDDDQKFLAVEMDFLYEESTLLEIRKRIVNAIKNIFRDYADLRDELNNEDINLPCDIAGSRSFFALEKKPRAGRIGDMHWDLVHGDLDRLLTFGKEKRTENLIILKLDSARQEAFEQAQQDSTHVDHNEDLKRFDCQALYRHADESFEWRPCRIMRKEIRDEFKDEMDQKKKYIDKSTKFGFDAQCYAYWVEFLHLKDFGKSHWHKRNGEEVLFSASYTRSMKRDFKAQTFAFIKQMYSKTEDKKLKGNIKKMTTL